MDKVVFEIERHIDTILTRESGWRKELNIVSWNGGEAKYDIREWNADHTKMTRGITLSNAEAYALTQALLGEFDDCFKICSECGKIMFEGFVINGGDEHYCSEECLQKHYTLEEYEQMNEENDDDNYWTDWR